MGGCLRDELASFGPNALRMDWKGFILDQMGHFSVYDVPNLVFAILVAAGLGYGSGRFGLRGTAADTRSLTVWAAVMALGAGIVRSQLGLAVVLLGILLFARPGTQEGPPRSALVLVSVLGLGCGSGAALIMMVLAIPAVLLLRWSSNRRTS